MGLQITKKHKPFKINRINFDEDATPLLIVSEDVPDVVLGFKDFKDPEGHHVLIHLKRSSAISMTKHLLTVFKDEL